MVTEERIKLAMNRTWDAIASDALALCEGGSCDRDQVIEFVLDADRMLAYGEDDAAYRATLEWPRATVDRIAREAFPHERYGY